MPILSVNSILDWFHPNISTSISLSSSLEKQFLILGIEPQHKKEFFELGSEALNMSTFSGVCILIENSDLKNPFYIVLLMSINTHQ